MRGRSREERSVRCLLTFKALSKWVVNFESSLSHDCCRTQFLCFDLSCHYVEISLHLVQLEAPLKGVVLDEMLTLTVAESMSLLHVDLAENFLDL